MIENVSEFLGTVAQSGLAKAARRSAGNVWNAHRAALDTTRQEAGRMLVLAIDEGQRLNALGRKSLKEVVENVTLQDRMDRVIRRIGLPTARDVNALSRRVDALSAKVKVRAPKKATRRARRRTA